jgi:hypothetical protein
MHACVGDAYAMRLRANTGVGGAKKRSNDVPSDEGRSVRQRGRLNAEAIRVSNADVKIEAGRWNTIPMNDSQLSRSVTAH